MSPAGKREGTIVHEDEPLNCEPARAALAEASLTATDAFYVRSHGAFPEVDRAAHRVRVCGLVEQELELSLDELADGRFALRDVAATLQCAGNRRAGLLAARDIPGEAPWGPGATGTAAWGGASLPAVLAAARPTAGARYVAFIGTDVSHEAEPSQAYGASISLRKAMRDECLLAWEMNGEPLLPAHGAPLRAVIPGYVGARSVKWLSRIELRDVPWDGFYQDVAYRLLPPDGEPAPGAGMPLGEVALNADVLVPDDGAEVRAGRTTLRGYAFAGGERRVARVDVSTDAGVTWAQADLDDDLGRWAWRLWRLDVELAPGEHEVRVRAWDSAAATQPEDPATVWNPKGYVNNAQGRMTLRVTA